MLVRLLQQFSTVELAQEVAPESKPPPRYMECPLHNGKEKVWIKSHLTMYANVSRFTQISYTVKWRIGVMCSSMETQNGLWVKMGEAPSLEIVWWEMVVHHTYYEKRI